MKATVMKAILLLLCLSSLLLATCDLDAKAILFISDLIDTKNQTEPVYCTATISLPMPSADNKQQVVDLISSYFLQPENIREGEKEYSTVLLADVQIPLTYQKADPTLRSMFSIIAEETTTSFPVSMYLNKQLFTSLNAEVYKIAYQGITVQELGLSIQINNDTKGKVKISTAAAYVNSKPIPFPSTIEIDRRQIVDLVPSDVLRDTLLQGDTLLAFSVVK